MTKVSGPQVVTPAEALERPLPGLAVVTEQKRTLSVVTESA